MIIGIDATNIRVGGGVTHLREMLSAADPERDRFDSIVVWARRRTLDVLPDHPWLKRRHDAVFERSFVARARWQAFALAGAAKAENCSVLLVPGGTYAGNFRPIVSMSRNMLPFDWPELCRYGLSAMAVKLLLLRFVQAHTFRRSDGVIFLTEHARTVIERSLGKPVAWSTVIPHGVSTIFYSSDDVAIPRRYTEERPFRLLYVSIIEVYKHQRELVRAVLALRQKGYPIELELVGAAYAPEMKRLQRIVTEMPQAAHAITFTGPLGHREQRLAYAKADLVVFASTCENLPNILLEAMCTNRPIICSKTPPMPQILGERGVYFDATNIESIERAILAMFTSPELRAASAAAAHREVVKYTWERCAEETMACLHTVASKSARGFGELKVDVL